MRSLVRRSSLVLVCFAFGVGAFNVGCSTPSSSTSGSDSPFHGKTREEALSIDKCSFELVEARADYSKILSSQLKPARCVEGQTSGCGPYLTLAEQATQTLLLDKLSHLDEAFQADALPAASQHLQDCAKVVLSLPIDKDPKHYPKDLPRCDKNGNCQLDSAITTKADSPGCPPASPDFNCKAVVDAAYGSWSTGMDPAEQRTEGGGYQCDVDYFSSAQTMSGFWTNFDLYAHANAGRRTYPDNLLNIDNETTKTCHKQTRTLAGNYQMRWVPYVKFVPRWIWNANQKPGAAPGTPVGWVNNTSNVTTFTRDGTTYPALCSNDANDTVTVSSRVTPVMNLPYSVILNTFEDGASSRYVRDNGQSSYKSEVNADYTCFGPGTGADGFTHVASDVRNQQDLFVQPDCTDVTGWNAGVNGSMDIGSRPGGTVGFQGGVHSESRCARGGGNPKQAVIGCLQPNTFSVNVTTGPITPGGNLAADSFPFQKGTRDDGDHGALGLMRLGMQWNALYSYAQSTPAFPGFRFPAHSIATVKAGDFNVGQSGGDRVKTNYKLEFDMEACTLKRNGQTQGGDSCVVNTKIWQYANPTAGEPTAAQLSAILRRAGLE